MELICSCPHVWAAAASLYLVIDDVMSSLISHWLLSVYMRVRAQLLLDSLSFLLGRVQSVRQVQVHRDDEDDDEDDGGPLPLLCPQCLSWRWVSVSCLCHMKTLHISKQAVYWRSGLNNKQTNKQTNSSWTLCVCVFSSGQHEDLRLIGCSDFDKENTYGLDGEVMWYMDFKNDKEVLPQPSFIDPISIPGAAGQAKANQQVCKQNLEVLREAYKDVTLENGKGKKQPVFL